MEKVVSVGDVHGDCDALIAALHMGGVVDAGGRWTGGKSHAVQIGDIPARGPQSRKAYDYLMGLEQEAEAAGGRVHCIIGNHDAMVMYGDLRGVLAEEFEEFKTPDSERLLKEKFEKDLAGEKQKGEAPATPEAMELYRTVWDRNHPPGWVEHRRAFQETGKYGAWIRQHNSVIRIDDTLYVHAGISPNFLNLTAAQINQTIRHELEHPHRLPPGLCSNTDGPLWYRGFAEGDEAELAAHVTRVLRIYGVRRIVIGHSVTRTAILPRFGTRIVNIDLGLSRIYKRPAACLVLEKGVPAIVFRDQRFPMPGPTTEDRLNYLRAAAKADVQPSPIEDLIGKLTTAAAG